MFNENQNDKNSAEVAMKKSSKKRSFLEAVEITKSVEPEVAESEEVVNEEIIEEVEPEPPKAIVVDVDNLRIRTTPEAVSNQNVKFLIPKGAEVVILGETEGQFIKVAVEHDGTITDGYAMLSFLKML